MGVKLFVGRLPYEISEEELSKAFSSMEKLTLSISPRIGNLESQKDSHSSHFPRRRKQRLIKAMNGSEIKGRKIVVEESSSGGSSRDRGGRRKQSKR